MRLTQFSEYALRAAIYLARNRDRTVKLAEIAEAQNIPPASLSQPLRWLAGKGIILSRAGFQGGYRLHKNPAEISLRQVIEAAEGPLFYNDCLVHGRPCETSQDHWCPVHEIWEEAKRSFLATLERYSLEEMASRVSRWDMVETALQEVLKKK